MAAARTRTDQAVARIITQAVTSPTRNDKTLFSAIRALGLTIGKRDGEYRISRPGLPRDRAEAIAAYTTDRDDAWDTAKMMAKDPRSAA
ncbi:MAG: hypothetical protein ACREB5_02590 [Sphingomonadaceae bacterium]